MRCGRLGKDFGTPFVVHARPSGSAVQHVVGIKQADVVVEPADAGQNERSATARNGPSGKWSRLSSRLPKPPSVFLVDDRPSNAVHSVQCANRDARRRCSTRQSPMMKSKSVGASAASGKGMPASLRRYVMSPRNPPSQRYIARLRRRPRPCRRRARGTRGPSGRAPSPGWRRSGPVRGPSRSAIARDRH